MRRNTMFAKTQIDPIENQDEDQKENNKNETHFEELEDDDDQDSDELQEKIEELEQQSKESEEKYRRALADYRNLEQRSQTERIQFIQLANRDLMGALLEPIDFLHTATQHIKDKGLEMVIQRFHQVLEERGLDEIKINTGQEFDEKTMDAVDTADGKENAVIEVKQKGYRLHGTVIRHAKVVVGKGK